MMIKFYIQSGNFRTTISAQDSEKAALWAIHKVMEQVLPLNSSRWNEPPENDLGRSANQFMVLGEVMMVSERGFDDPFAEQLDTLELQIHWQQLATALARLEAMVLTHVPDCYDGSWAEANCPQDLALCELVSARND